MQSIPKERVCVRAGALFMQLASCKQCARRASIEQSKSQSSQQPRPLCWLPSKPERSLSSRELGQIFSIPDAQRVNGSTVPSINSSDIVAGDNVVINDATITLNGLTHSYAGDLIVTLTHLDTSTTASLFDRVGRGPSEGPGYASNYSGDYSFNDSFTGDLWAAAAAVVDSSNIPADNYFPTGAGSGVKVPLLTSISGLPSSGTWRLTISDNNGEDDGSTRRLDVESSRSGFTLPGTRSTAPAGSRSSLRLESPAASEVAHIALRSVPPFRPAEREAPEPGKRQARLSTMEAVGCRAAAGSGFSTILGSN